MLLDGCKRADTQSLQDRNYAYFSSNYRTRPLFSYFSMGNERLTTTAKARSLGVVLDDNMLFHAHIIHLMYGPEGNSWFCFPESPHDKYSKKL